MWVKSIPYLIKVKGYSPEGSPKIEAEEKGSLFESDFSIFREKYAFRVQDCPFWVSRFSRRARRLSENRNRSEGNPFWVIFFDHLRRIVSYLTRMIGQSGQNGLFRSRFSILGQPPRRLSENRIAGRVISFKILQRRASRKDTRWKWVFLGAKGITVLINEIDQKVWPERKGFSATQVLIEP